MSYPLLERINAPGEIKNLPADEMPALCEATNATPTSC